LDTDETEESLIAINHNTILSNYSIDSVKVVKSGKGYVVGDTFGDGISTGLVEEVSDKGGILKVKLTESGRDYLHMPQLKVKSKKGKGAVLEAVKKNSHNDYTHCEIHPSMWFSVVSQVIPFMDHNPSPRNVFQCSMGKQAIGVYTTNYNSRMDTLAYVMCNPMRPLVYNKTLSYTNGDKLPQGQQLIVAFMCYTGYNQEDSVIINKSAVDRGMLSILALKTTKDKESKHKIGTSGGMEYFGIPDRTLTKGMRGKADDYAKLDPDTGVARVGSAVGEGDVIIGKYIEISEEEKKANATIMYKDISKELKHNENGYVDKVLDGKSNINNINHEGERIVKVRIVQYRKLEIGDKAASRAAQKGTCGMLYRQEDMPFTHSGITPDLLINAHATPTRMTIGQLLETLCSKVGAIKGKMYDSTAFTHFDKEGTEKQLEEYGFHKSCDEIMYNGFTGQMIKVPIFIGPTYYQRLKHMVADKLHSRENGPMQLLTRQPLEGRSRDGGLKVGEMEKDSFVSHGASQFLKERFMESSDSFKIFVSKEHKSIVVANPDKNLFMYNGKNLTRDQVSCVHLPYAMKLLIHEMTAMGLDIKMVT
jgi:DNA-directed RNA polymerase II subunit RPB2